MLVNILQTGLVIGLASILVGVTLDKADIKGGWVPGSLGLILTFFSALGLILSTIWS